MKRDMLHIRVSDKEKKAMEKAQKRGGFETLSAWLRDAIKKILEKES